VAFQPYDPAATDFREEVKALRKIRKTESFKAMFIPDSWLKAAMIAPQLRYYRLSRLKLLGINAWHDEKLLEQTQPADMEGAVFTDGIAPEADRLIFNQYARRFFEEFGERPGIMESQAYESVQLVLNVINRYRIRDRQQLRLALDHLEDYPGVLGSISVDGTGRFKKKIYLFMVSEGGFVLLSD
jgi:hypothetical protein